MNASLTKVFSPLTLVVLAGTYLCAVDAQTVPTDSLPIIELPQLVPNKPTGMRELVLLVLQNHPELSQAEAESRMAVSRVNEAKASRYPQLTFSSSYGQEQQKLYSSMP